MNPFRRSFILIILILLLPSLIFSLYELGTLRQNEKVIEEIYNNQLDAILFSINQYSEDIVSSWANRIEDCFDEEYEVKVEKLEKLNNESPGIEEIMLHDPQSGSLITLIPENKIASNIRKIDSLLIGNDSIINILQSYLRSGYRKIESLEIPESHSQLLLFAMEVKNSSVIILIQHNPELFITEMLNPKIQEVSREKFYITASASDQNTPLYTSQITTDDYTDVSHTRPFWILHNYTMGIELLDTTISDLARERSVKDLLLIGILDIVLLLGIWYIFRSVKKQMELSQLKTDFVSNVSHEIRTPLALISMYIETLEMGRVNTKKKIQEYYGVIQQETQRLSNIVNQILNFAQLESGKRKFNLKSVSLNEIIENTLASFRIRLNNEGFNYKSELTDNLPYIIADKEAIRDIIVNLIDNAIKYSSATKSIIISTKLTKDERVCLEISDQGIGISESEQQHIFDKFYRVTQKNLAFKAKGSGLGLAIVKYISDAHKIDIAIKSKKNKGSTFQLMFPKHKTLKP